MGADGWLVLIVLVAMIVGLGLRRMSPTVGVVGALMLLFASGAADADIAFAGFSNAAPLTIGALYVVAGAVRHTGALAFAVTKLAGGRGAGRIVLGSAVSSAFVANTPVVAILIDPVIRWAREHDRHASQVLIPLSYATILGGMTTIIGTSTNLVGSGVLEELSFDPLSFFEPARFGVPVAVAGLAITSFLGPRLLPARGQDGTTESRGMPPEFAVSCEVVAGGPMDGVPVEAAGLRNLPGLFLVALHHAHGGEVVAPVSPHHVLQAGDVCSFVGSVNEIVELQNRPGLRFAEAEQLGALEDGQHAWFEAVVGNGSALVGQTLKQAEFRGRYQAAVVALHRSGRPIAKKLGDERLRLGDSLLLVSDLGFARRWDRRTDFVLVRRRSEPPPTASGKSAVSLAILGAVIVLSLFQITDVLRAAVIGAGLTVVTGVLSPRQARDAVDLNVVVLIGASIGLGGAATASGLAERLAQGLTVALDAVGVWGVALGVVVAALVLTEFVTNAGAVGIMVPIAVSAAADVGADPRLFALGAVAAASASFLTPIGYQTNTMVYGPGRYHFTDFLRLGVPLTAMVIAVVPLFMVHGPLW